MNQSRPEQAILSSNTDLSKTAETKAVIERMVDGLNDHRIEDIGEFFSEGFRWMGNTGCGTKKGLKEFQDNWQNHFKLHSLTKFASMKLDYTWASGQQHLAGKKRFTQEHSWA